MVRTTISNTASRENVAEMATKIAETLGILGGKQDEYASALGGFNSLTFTDRVTVERLRLEPPVADALRARLLLVYSGQSRLSTQVHDLVWQRFRSGDTAVRSALAALTRIAGDMTAALLARDLEAFGNLIDENWARQRELHPAVTTPEIDTLVDRARRSGAVAAKACGAGGGGCVLVFAREGLTERVRAAVESRRTPIIEFDFDTYGVHLRKG
jgi:D-glycero-alpha-D-manno-heptose-7-phosphate kinase